MSRPDLRKYLKGGRTCLRACYVACPPRPSDATLLAQPDIDPVINDDRTLTTGGYPINHGNSFVLAVDFDDQGPVARAIMTYSQSEDPDSPRFDDQTLRYGRGEGLRDALFHEADLLADPGLTELQRQVTR